MLTPLLKLFVTGLHLPLMALANLLGVKLRREKSYARARTPVLFVLLLTRFLRKFEPRAKALVVMGSMLRGGWRRGADADIILFYDEPVPLRVKERVYDAYFALSLVLGMGLEEAPCPHPPIWFADNPVKRALALAVMKERGDLQVVREFAKSQAPKAIECRRFIHAIS